MVLMQSTGLTDNKQTGKHANKQTNEQHRHVELVEGGANACDEDMVDGAYM